jgi:hypothetical protein
MAEPAQINVLFTASRIMPHATAVKFIYFIIEKFPDSQSMQDTVWFFIYLFFFVCSTSVYLRLFSIIFAYFRLFSIIFVYFYSKIGPTLSNA